MPANCKKFLVENEIPFKEIEAEFQAYSAGYGFSGPVEVKPACWVPNPAFGDDVLHGWTLARDGEIARRTAHDILNSYGKL